MKRTIAVFLNGVVAAVGMAMGSYYLIASEITSYHKEVLGVDWSGLAPGVRKLLIILMKGTGDAALVTALAIVLFLSIPFRRGENWARWAILAVGLTLLLPMLIGAVYLVRTTGASSPWWLNAILIVFLLAAFHLGRDT